MKEKFKRWASAILRMHDWLSEYCFIIGAVTLLVLTLSIGYEVVVRYFFNSPTAWAMDFSEYILIYSTFFAASWLLKTDGHTSVTVVVDFLGRKSRLVVEFIAFVISAVVCSVLTYQGVVDTWDAFQREVMIVRPIVVPKYIILWVIPFGCLMVFIYFIRKIIGVFLSRKDN